MGRLQGESCCPQPDGGNPAVRDETGGRRKLIEARNEAPACSDEEPVTATPRCPPIQRLRSIPTRMRESRLSGSVEGVMSDHDSYSDSHSVCLAGRFRAPRKIWGPVHVWLGKLERTGGSSARPRFICLRFPLVQNVRLQGRRYSKP